MGCFDTINYECPNCEADIAVQSKGGSCDLTDYWVDSRGSEVPANVVGYIGGDIVTCDNCGQRFTVETKTETWLEEYDGK